LNRQLDFQIFLGIQLAADDFIILRFEELMLFLDGKSLLC